MSSHFLSDPIMRFNSHLANDLAQMSTSLRSTFSPFIHKPVHPAPGAIVNMNQQPFPYTSACPPNTTSSLVSVSASSVATVQSAFHHYGNMGLSYAQPQCLQSPVLLQQQQPPLPQFHWHAPSFVGQPLHDLYRPLAQRGPELAPVNSPPSVASPSFNASKITGLADSPTNPASTANKSSGIHQIKTKREKHESNKRKRGPQPRQRRQRASERERNRMHALNRALEELRSRLIPIDENGSQSSQQKPMSKIETLRRAMDYIRALSQLLEQTEAPSPQNSDNYLVGKLQQQQQHLQLQLRTRDWLATSATNQVEGDVVKKQRHEHMIEAIPPVPATENYLNYPYYAGQNNQSDHCFYSGGFQ